MLTNQDNWFQPIEEALNKFFGSRLATELKDLAGMKRFGHLGMFAGIFHLGKNFLEFFDQNDFPVPVLNGARLSFEPFRNFLKEPFQVIPPMLGYGVAKLLEATYKEKRYDGYMNWWRGNGVIIAAYSHTMALDRAMFFLDLLLRKTHVAKSVVLLKPPDNTAPRVAQEIWEPRCEAETLSAKDLMLQGVDNPRELSPEQRDIVMSTFYYTSQSFLEFPDGSPPVFRADDNLYNMNHPLATLMFRCICYSGLRRAEQRADVVALGRLTDALERFERWRLRTDSDVQAAAEALVNAAQEFGLKVPSSVTLNSDELWYGDPNPYMLHNKLEMDCREEFGYEQ